MTSSAVRLMPATLSKELKELKYYKICRFYQRLVWVGREITCCNSRCLQHWLQLWQPGRCEDAGLRLAPGGPPLLQADGGALPQPQHTLDSWQPSPQLQAQHCRSVIFQMSMMYTSPPSAALPAGWLPIQSSPNNPQGPSMGSIYILNGSASQASSKSAC